MEKYDLLIKNGMIATAGDRYKADIGVMGEKIVCISNNLEYGNEIIDASGKYVLPGAIDIHTHLDAPLHGSHTMDNWYEGTYTAAFGGVTCVVDYPIQVKGQSLREVINNSNKKAEGKAVLDYSFSPVITERTSEVYSEIPILIEEGYPTFKVFMAYAFRARDEELIKLLDVISSNGGLLGVHAENDWAIEYIAQKMISQGKIEPVYHCLSRPPITEEEATGRVIKLSKMVDASVLIVHVSSKGALKEIAEAKNRGEQVYAETCPHFLLLDEKVYSQSIEEAAKFVVTPPIRSQEHRDALWKALRSGIVSLVSSDHCAFSIKEKLRLGTGAFTKIPHGAPGIETRVPVLFSEGVNKGKITINKFVELVSTNPAKLAGLYPQKGTIAVGSDADLLIMDAEKEMKVSVKTLHGVCDFTPFEGLNVKGWPEVVLSRGKVVVSNDKLIAKPGIGKLVKREKFRGF